MILAVFIYFFHPRHRAQGVILPILGVNRESPRLFFMLVIWRRPIFPFFQSRWPYFSGFSSALVAGGFNRGFERSCWVLIGKNEFNHLAQFISLPGKLCKMFQYRSILKCIFCFLIYRSATAVVSHCLSSVPSFYAHRTYSPFWGEPRTEWKLYE